ncbi:MAG TPA: hypothetical protein VM582_08120 [Candidatus Thermoplasmatota archaeon]|nr:hypothetical protein [Candidatus Thermoplasmatota archaeon]
MNESLRTTRELKVLIPARLAVAVHSQKILTGQTIAHVVEEALNQYFQNHPMAAPALTLGPDA